MTYLPQKKKQLTKKDRILIDWFIWERLLGTLTPGPIDWNQLYRSLNIGRSAWQAIKQGPTGPVTLLAWYQNIHKPGSKEWRPAIIIRAALAVAKDLTEKGGGE